MPMPDSNELSLTIKVKIVDPINDFYTTSEQYRLACNFVSNWIFNNNFEINQLKIHKYLYSDIREKFGLKSQMAISVVKTVSARYQSIKSFMKDNPITIKDKLNGDKKYKYYKTLEHLTKPVNFRRIQCDLVRNRDYEINFETNKVKITTMSGRHEFSFISNSYNDRYLKDKDWKLGTAKLLKFKNDWYLHIAITKYLPLNEDNFSNIIGVDRGINFIATTYDSKGKSKFVKGKEILAKRMKFKETREALQKVGTKSAKRKLKRINQRENRWIHDVNHCISKTLVEANSLIVLENLENIKEAIRTTCKYKQTSWSYRELASMITYKARLVNSKVIEVDASYTSQRCPKCANISKLNRDRSIHLFSCTKCGYSSNDDRAASMNIYELGKIYLLGEMPSFKTLQVE